MCNSRERIAIRENGLSNSRERIAIRENELSNLRERITNPWERIAQFDITSLLRAFVSKNTLYQVWLKLGQWLKGNFISRQCIIPTWWFLQNWVEIGQGVREKNLFAIKMENLRSRHIFTIMNMVLHLKKNNPHWCLFPCLVEIGQVVLE